MHIFWQLPHQYPIHLVGLFLIYSIIACSSDKQPIEQEKAAGKVETQLAQNSPEEYDIPIPTKTSFPYNLEEPDDKISLPNRLKEISGLGIDPTGKYLYAVQDEEGDVFIIDIEKEEVADQIKFHKEGDYEGIEYINGKVFVVKSNGTLYEVQNLGQPNQDRTKYKFDFTKSSDVEGLGYDPVTNSLLVSCKGKALRGESAKLKKGIYSIDMTNMTMDTIPKYTVSLEAVKHFLNTNTSLVYFDKLIKVFKPDEEFIFGPSGIAIHPITKEIYLTSAVGNVLLVLDRNNQIVHLQKLRKKIHEQPEGIVFDQAGNMYISNEGKGGKGKIFFFEYKKGVD